MLVAQAAAQFTWWTGLTPSLSRMHEVALARLAPASSVPTESA
jgi:shikimate 5-dehydrogenase